MQVFCPYEEPVIETSVMIGIWAPRQPTNTFQVTTNLKDELFISSAEKYS